jgi:competence protein ComEA
VPASAERVSVDGSLMGLSSAGLAAAGSSVEGSVPRPAPADLASVEADSVEPLLAELSPAGSAPVELAAAGRPSAAGLSSAGRVRAWLAELVPGSFAGARVDPGRRGAASLVALAVSAAVVVGFLTWRSRPAAVPVAPPAAAPAGAFPGGSAGPTTTATRAPIVVAVAGKVRRPGVVSLPAGARVIDAVRAAGGALPGVDLGLLNLARRLSDGELVVVGGPAGSDAAGAGPASGPAPGSAAPAGASGPPLDLNAATAEQLDALPGVGPVLAQRIVEFRTVHGRFDTVDQLRDVDGIGDSKFAQLRDRVTV